MFLGRCPHFICNKPLHILMTQIVYMQIILAEAHAVKC